MSLHICPIEPDNGPSDPTGIECCPKCKSKVEEQEDGTFKCECGWVGEDVILIEEEYEPPEYR